VTESVYTPIKSDATRTAALLSGEIDFVIDPSLQDLAQPTGTLIAHQVNGWTAKGDVRYPFDAAAAQKLLAEAGYPQGFEVDFACSAGRYINDEQLCQAITALWAKVGVKAKLRSLPFATYFPMIQRNEASIYLLGWGVPTFDAFYTLQSLIRSPGAGGDGNFNLGRFSDPQQDALIERIKKETDATTRNGLIEKALIQDHALISHIPLYNQVIPWAASQKVDVLHRADNRIDWRVLKVN